jgi:hypothetical protein
MPYKQKIAVPYFHSVMPQRDPSWAKRFLTQPLDRFEHFLQYLKKGGWQTVFLDEMYELRKRDITGGRFCALTFDDGYADNYIYVYPLLQKYGLKGTIFVSPLCVDEKRSKAMNLFDLWKGNTTADKLPLTAYLNWQEIEEMQQSGVIDIQSHTMNHTKYYCSDIIESFHHPGDDCVYQVNNFFPELRAYYFSYQGFEQLLPYGTPFFQHKASLLTRIHVPDSEFVDRTVELLNKEISSGDYDFQECLLKIMPLYNEFKRRGRIFGSVESEAEYEARIRYEIADSRQVLENRLKKPVRFLCWPHGGNNAKLHGIALEAGFLATTVGKSGAAADTLDRFERIGIGFESNKMKSDLMNRFRMNLSIGRMPETLLNRIRVFGYLKKLVK